MHDAPCTMHHAPLTPLQAEYEDLQTAMETRGIAAKAYVGAAVEEPRNPVYNSWVRNEPVKKSVWPLFKTPTCSSSNSNVHL